MDVREVLHKINPPEIEIVNSYLQDDDTLHITYRLCDRGNGYSQVSLVINGNAFGVTGKRGIRMKNNQEFRNIKCQHFSHVLTLNNQENRVSIQAFDKNNTILSRSNEIKISLKRIKHKKSNLYAVFLATEKYANQDLNLNYPVTDALGIKKELLAKGKNFFDSISTYSLFDQNLSLNTLTNVFKKIREKIHSNDVFLLFMAGHGFRNRDDGLFYYLFHTASDFNADKAISSTTLQELLTQIYSNKTLVMIDACDAGGFLAGKKTKTFEMKSTLKRLAYSTGRNFLMASDDRHAALEGYRGHGLFSYTVIDAFDNAYFGKSKKLSVTALSAYVEQMLPQISMEAYHYKQKPVIYLNGISFYIGERN